jgi:very-short-patch-repair endonuclease
MEIGEYADSSLGEALRHYEDILKNTDDNYIEDEAIFDSPQEEKLYSLLIQTDFYKENKDKIHLIPQFEIGRYIKDEFHDQIPNYRVDFLLTLSEGGKERSLIIEYDGLEYHFKDPDNTNKYNFDNEYTEYDTARRLELESYGYGFLRINKFNLMPEDENQTEVDVLNGLLLQALD